jgi:hypothetical protein
LSVCCTIAAALRDGSAARRCRAVARHARVRMIAVRVRIIALRVRIIAVRVINNGPLAGAVSTVHLLPSGRISRTGHSGLRRLAAWTLAQY